MSLVKWIDLQESSDERGFLTVAESGTHIPFEIKRIYYLSKLSSGQPRGFHAHKQLEQVAVCVSGYCKVLLDYGNQKECVELSSSSKALRIEKMVWHEMHDFSEDCIFLVFASEHYDESDYIRSYQDFISELVK